MFEWFKWKTRDRVTDCVFLEATYEFKLSVRQSKPIVIFYLETCLLLGRQPTNCLPPKMLHMKWWWNSVYVMWCTCTCTCTWTLTCDHHWNQDLKIFKPNSYNQPWELCRTGLNETRHFKYTFNIEYMSHLLKHTQKITT